MNYRTALLLIFKGVLIGKGRLLERGAYFENLTFVGAVIREWALIRSFMVLATNIDQSQILKTSVRNYCC